MTHHAFGHLVADHEIGGLLETTGCVLISSYTLIHAESSDGSPVMGVQIAGTISGTDDTINTIYLLRPNEAGALVHGFLKSAEQLEPEDQMEFQFASEGLIEGLTGRRSGDWNEDEDSE